MYDSKKIRGLMKKTIAVVLGITMTFGALSLPAGVVSDGFGSASAETLEVGDCTFNYTVIDRTGEKTVRIDSVTCTGETVEIPSSIKVDGVNLAVTDIDDYFMANDETVKTVIFPESVIYIGDNVLEHAAVEKIVLSNELRHLGDYFAQSCYDLADVEYTGTKIVPQEMGSHIFLNDYWKLYNENTAICLGNWIIYCRWIMDDPIKYRNTTEIKVSELSTNGVPIEYIADDAFYYNEVVTTVDLQGIKYVGASNFGSYTHLTTLKNTSGVNEVGNQALADTPWLNNAQNNGLVKIGSSLIYYRTDDTVIDLSSGFLIGTSNVHMDAFKDCPNVDTIILNSDCHLWSSSFKKANDTKISGDNDRDMFLEKPVYNIKTLMIDGNELTNSLIHSNEKVYEWLKEYGHGYLGAAFLQDLTDQKIQEVFKQMDITYYGPNNDKKGTLTPTEEFYIRLKIHNYLSEFGTSSYNSYSVDQVNFLLGEGLNSPSQAALSQYMLECAGVDSKILYSTDFFWNSTKIGDEWFETDDHSDSVGEYRWFGLSGTRIGEMDPSTHTYTGAYDSYHDIGSDKNKTKRKPAQRTLGDMNGDKIRDKSDVEILWNHLSGEPITIDKKAADINFDGKIDVTDGVLLDQFVNDKPVDPKNVTKDGYAPAVKVAFVNGKDYDNIKYAYTDHEGYIELPDDLFEAPAGKKLSYDMGEVGKKVKITTPLTVINVKWEESFALGDVNGDGAIDIEDAVAIIQHINGITPLTDEEEKRADISKDKNIDIDDAVTLISYINGNSTF